MTFDVQFDVDGPAGPDMPESVVTMVEGRTVLVRPAGPHDADAVRAFFDALSPGALAMRFGAARRSVAVDEIARFTSAPGPGGAGLIAVTGGEGERVIALGRYEVTPGTTEAEFAIAVADTWQGHGLGTELISRLLDHAAQVGLDALWAVIRPGNFKMLELLRTLGCKEETALRPGEIYVRIPAPPDSGLALAGVARRLGAARRSLEPMFRPASIAVVGASRNPDSPGAAVLRNLVDSGYPGRIFAVNHAATSIDGMVAYPALAAVPEHVDLAIVAVPAEAVPGVVRQAAANEVRALIVLSAGFAEVGETGRAFESEIRHVARTAGMRMLGPNCLGLATSDPEVPFDATFAAGALGPGVIAFASQSGGLGIGALAHCRQRGIGLSAFVSVGNMADVDPEDLLAWWHTDAHTRVVLLYLEGLTGSRSFPLLAREVARTKPILALKAGRAGAARRAASSHTAALAAGEEVTDAVFALAGIVRVDTMAELVDAGELIASQPLPSGNRVLIIGNAGGLGVVAADACAAFGLEVPPLPADVTAELARLGAAATRNPVDLGANVTADTFSSALARALASGAVDAVLALYAPIVGGDVAGVVAVLDQTAGVIPICGSLVGADPPAARPPNPVPLYPFPEAAAAALGAAVRAAAAARRPADPPPQIRDIDRVRARRALASVAPGAWLGQEAIAELLAAYGLPVQAFTTVRSAGEAASAQRELGAPVAVKRADPSVVHKLDVGGVVLDCHTPDAAADAYRRVVAHEGDPAIVQPMAMEGLDLIVGAVADPQFGPLVLAGIGGGEAEVWKDRAVALAPVGPRTAAEMWDHLKGRPLLDGWRGSAGADRDALADCVLRLAALAAEQPLLAEIDLNPVRTFGPGRGVAILDVKVRRAGTD